MIKNTLITIALSIFIVGCGVGENLTEEKVKYSLQDCLQEPLTSIGPIIMDGKYNAKVTFKYGLNNLSADAYYKLDSKGNWYMTQLSSFSYSSCRDRLPFIVK